MSVGKNYQGCNLQFFMKKTFLAKIRNGCDETTLFMTFDGIEHDKKGSKIKTMSMENNFLRRVEMHHFNDCFKTDYLTRIFIK